MARLRDLRYARYLLLALPVLATGCDTGQAIEVIGCSIEDEKLGVAFRDPAKAKSYLKDLSKRLGEDDPHAIREAADLVARVSECL